MCEYDLTIAIVLGISVAALIRWVLVPRLICVGLLPKEENMAFKDELPIIFALLTMFVLTVESAIWLFGLYCN